MPHGQQRFCCQWGSSVRLDRWLDDLKCDPTCSPWVVVLLSFGSYLLLEFLLLAFSNPYLEDFSSFLAFVKRHISLFLPRLNLLLMSYCSFLRLSYLLPLRDHWARFIFWKLSVACPSTTQWSFYRYLPHLRKHTHDLKNKLSNHFLLTFVHRHSSPSDAWICLGFQCSPALFFLFPCYIPSVDFSLTIVQATINKYVATCE